jgi:hypothetical protein
MKIFERFARTLYRLQIFAVPAILFGLISLLFHSKTENKIVTLIFLSVGFPGGIFPCRIYQEKVWP